MIAALVVLAVWALVATGFALWLGQTIRNHQDPGAHRTTGVLADGTRLTDQPTREETTR